MDKRVRRISRGASLVDRRACRASRPALRGTVVKFSSDTRRRRSRRPCSRPRTPPRGAG
jgi:hypothetical protein